MLHPYKILSIGGSIIIPKTGFDPVFLKQFRSFILSEIKKGERFILVIGGGATCRTYQQAARQVVPLTNDELDWIGIHTTIYNAEFVRMLFGDIAHADIVTNPTKKVRTQKPLIIAAGWKPGCSTDTDAVHLAKTYGAREVLNVSNIECVYDKDPNQFPDAKKIPSIDWKTFRRDIVGDTWSPGHSAPFDPVASRMAERLKLRVSIVNGMMIPQLRAAIHGRKFTGTIIHP